MCPATESGKHELMGWCRCVARDRFIQLIGVLLAAWMSDAASGQPVGATGNRAPAGIELLGAEQLDQLTAPIALYPDSLLGSVLAASTYPLEVVEAARWLDEPGHQALKGDALAAALEPQAWDPSVKLLVSFPEVLNMMNSNLEWTERLGDAFLAQQTDVMDSVQRLRQRAAAKGFLRSTPQQTVSTEQGDITIAPANPDVIYVPYYVPTAVYGPWPWPDYPPYYFALTPGISYDGAFIGFGIGIPIFEPYWGWYGWDWPAHGFRVIARTPRHGRPIRESQLPAGPWHHDLAHRRGVPYRDSATAARFLGADAASRRPYRGFPPGPAPHPATQVPAPAPSHAHSGPGPKPMAQPSAGRLPSAHPGPPAFESFGRGPQVRGQENRGISSRSAPAPSSRGAGGNPGHH